MCWPSLPNPLILIGQLQVSNGILMKRVIACDVTAGVLGGTLKCIGSMGIAFFHCLKLVPRDKYTVCAI